MKHAPDSTPAPTPEALVYQLSLRLSDAERTLAALVGRGGRLGNRARGTLRDAAGSCGAIAQCLAGPSEQLALVQVAGKLAEVVKPMSRKTLAEHLLRAQGMLLQLAASEPELERVTVTPASLSWLQEFLSDCCLSLLRDLARRQHGQAAPALAMGS